MPSSPPMIVCGAPPAWRTSRRRRRPPSSRRPPTTGRCRPRRRRAPPRRCGYGPGSTAGGQHLDAAHPDPHAVGGAPAGVHRTELVMVDLQVVPVGHCLHSVRTLWEGRARTAANDPAYGFPRDQSEHPSGERAAEQGQGHRVREPEGRRRQDDDDPEPCRCVRRGRASRPVRRHGSAGQPDDVAGHRSRLAREVDVRRARPRHADPRGHPQARDRRRLRLDRPRRRRDRDVDDDRPRALAAEGVRARSTRTTTSSASTRRRASGC